MPFAEQMLSEHGAFHPFGASMMQDGEIVSNAAYVGDDGDSEEVIEMLLAGFRSSAVKGEIKASALVYDIRTIPPGKIDKQDAIAVNLDHSENYSIVVMFPYSISEQHGLLIEDAFASAGDAEIFSK